jgi:hypothetical protein
VQNNGLANLDEQMVQAQRQIDKVTEAGWSEALLRKLRAEERAASRSERARVV